MTSATPGVERHARLDALRGVAVVWMVVFHFCFDLNHFRFIEQDFYRDPFWTVQRSLIVSLFLFCAGVGQAVAHTQGQGWRRFWRRWAQVAGCALLVSAGSWLVFGPRFISFGILHAVAVMWLLLRLGLNIVPWAASSRGVWLWCLLGGAFWLLGLMIQHPFFDTRWTNWLGLVTHKPATEDYVPLLPWLAAMVGGLSAGQWLLQRMPALLSGPLPPGLGPLALLGRWSLSVYMLHQPLLFALLIALTWIQR